MEKELLRLAERDQTPRLATEEDVEAKDHSIASSWLYSASKLRSVNEDEGCLSRTWLSADSAEGRAWSEFETTAWKSFGPFFLPAFPP